jgi:aminoglycoside phosphotransferase family enzyme/predicted kinase
MVEVMGAPPPDSTAGAGPAELVETHISILVFVGDRAYKLKKPVAFPFVDLRTREQREHLCHREVELNRRLAPDVYLGVADVTGPDGEVCDHLVVMRRMPADRRLTTLVEQADPDVEPIMAELGMRLARFHRSAERSAAIDEAASVERVARRWHDNFDELRPFVGSVLSEPIFADATSTADRFLAGRDALFAERIAGGHACDGHGDLQLDDVFALDDGPRVLDCIEFRDDLRFGDVAEDLAFLVMDLERVGAGRLVEVLLSAYEREAGEAIPRALLRFYVAYRAQVRAKVACLRAAQLPTSDPAHRTAALQAEQLLAQCASALADALPCLVLVGGLPGTGKSTVAAGLGTSLDMDVIRSDVVRKQLAGLDPDQSAAAGFGQGIYDQGSTRLVYDEMIEQAARNLERGRSTVLDASFSSEEDRRRCRAVAEAASVPIVELRCRLDADVAARRIRQRQRDGHDASDADEAIAAAMAGRADPWPGAADLDTARLPDDVFADALRLVARARHVYPAPSSTRRTRSRL